MERNRHPVSTRKRIVILISGRGSNMEALIKAARAKSFPARVVGVISNEPSARGLDLARNAQIPTKIVEHTRYATRQEFEEQIDRQLIAWNADLICLAGFMRIISPYLIGEWADRIINIHPSMLPDYPGLNVHQRVFEAGEKSSGCTAHYVREKVDFGPGIVQARVPLDGCASPAAIESRVLQFEHLIYPLAVRLFCGDRIEVIDEKVHFKGQSNRPPNSTDGGFNPLIVIDVRFESQIQRRAAQSEHEKRAGYAAEVRTISGEQGALSQVVA